MGSPRGLGEDAGDLEKDFVGFEMGQALCKSQSGEVRERIDPFPATLESVRLAPVTEGSG